MISAAGPVTKVEVAAVARQVRKIVNDMTAGFRVSTDFRWLDRMEPTAATHLAEIMDALAAKKVATAVRVVPDPHKDIGLDILSQFHYGPKIKLATFDSLVAALSVLMEEP